MTLTEFLIWLAGGGSIVLFSFFAERSAKFQALSSEGRFWVQMIGSGALALAAWAASTYVPPEVIEQISPAFVVLYGIVVSQLAHKLDK